MFLPLPLLVLMVSITCICAQSSRSITWRQKASDEALLQELTKYKTCEPSLMRLLFETLRSAQSEGSYISENMELLCRIFSFPNLRNILGSRFNPAWFPTKGRLVKGTLQAALKSKVFRSSPDIKEMLSVFARDIRMKGPGDEPVDLRNIAVPLGIHPPRNSDVKATDELFDIIDDVMKDADKAKQLKELFSSGSLPEVISDEFDASYYDKYGRLIFGIFVKMDPLHPAGDSLELFSQLLDKSMHKEKRFNPMLLYELNLPPISKVHDPFIKEMIFTTIDSKYRVEAQALEELLNDGELMSLIPNLTFKQFRSKSDLLRGVIHAYVSGLRRTPDPVHDARKMMVVFLEDKIGLKKSVGGQRIHKNLISALQREQRLGRGTERH